MLILTKHSRSTEYNLGLSASRRDYMEPPRARNRPARGIAGVMALNGSNNASRTVMHSIVTGIWAILVVYKELTWLYFHLISFQSTTKQR